MRLTQIKLAGFKSFVDPTVIPVPGRLVGVVGPNGCGKSNIIDAVRWVMGESRASELRGESMQDVIFNGSGQRKRAARASVELVFDNGSGRVGGQWAAYTELSLRRVLTRDGTSTYFINNQTVRRRDVHDLFLGTGLGTRGYAIIGQGMINRLIEARPQELRVYLEEAAGVSRYKERRRETENRLRDTRDNLTRLEDILQEIDRQLERLEQQAGQAQKYRELQADFSNRQQLLWLIQETQARDRQKTAFAAIEAARLRLEALRASLRSKESAIERVRQDHQEAATRLHDAQGVLYQAGADISRLEAERRHLAATQERLESRRHQLRQQDEQWQEQIAHCDEQLEALEAEHDILLAQGEEHAHRLETVQHQQPEIEAEVAAATAERETLRNRLAHLDQRLALADQADTDLRRQVDRLTSRQQRLEETMQELPDTDPLALEQAQQALDGLFQEISEGTARVDAQEAALARAEERRSACRDASQQAQARQAALQASHQALLELQEQLGKSDDLQAWLDKHGLGEAVPLWQHLQVAAGWETAVEAVLEERMAAIEVADLSDWVGQASMPMTRATLYQQPSHATRQAGLPDQSQDASLLLSQISASEPVRALLHHWLAGVQICPDLATARQRQADLGPGDMVVVPAGHRVDRHGIRFFAGHTEQTGVLARQAEIRQLHAELETARAHAAHAHEANQVAGQGYDETRASLVHLRKQVDDLIRRQHEQTAHVHTLRERHELFSQRRLQLRQEQSELQDDVAALHRQLEQTGIQADTLQAERDALEQTCDIREGAAQAAAARLEAHRAQQQEYALQQQQLTHQQRAIQARIDEHRRNRQLAHDESSRARTELETLQGELFALGEDDLSEQLQAALTARTQAEQDVGQMRRHHDDLAATLRDAEEARMRDLSGLEPLQEQIMALQLEEQAARLAVEQHAEALQQAQADRRHLVQQLQELPADARETVRLQGEVQQLKRRIQAMGDVNLAALQELETATQRKAFLDSQYGDLSDAVATLEAAIIKIDHETRERLSQTFEAVNGHFADLFPRLFGGGRAALTMTGDEILDAGVQVMAQPPGKRNTTIQLLSGGEKALTAIALVFSLFRLNPAPFCLLDEVDAPLDDANTGRYADLVASMSEQTQFVFVSHNKIAMQMATQLIGVTMQEQGVSRIVSVDMEAALKMADLSQSD